nr:MAG TPA: hypothetical protein [Caudoviricetes sp.]DAX44060.1 MAG TPA: hypothetical protein [Caudoviricetes sp.]
MGFFVSMAILISRLLSHFLRNRFMRSFNY